MTTDAHPAGQTAQPDASAALERLAAALEPSDFSTILTSGPGQPPRLTVASRHANFGDDIYADHRSYWWSWAEPICAVDDALTAAHKITAVLRSAQGATRG